jgi:hypothetical protein
MTDKRRTVELTERLRSFHSIDQQWIGHTFLRCIEDPLKPQWDNGNVRVNFIVLLLAVMALLAGATFVFFSLVSL